jgi:RecB family exonuclease
MPGFSFFSTGAAWERAFEEALRFLERPAGTLVLGPAIGEAGRAWIEDRYLSANNVRFGLRVQAWDEWVKACARESAIAAGRGFRPLDRVGLREHLRIVARTMADSGAFHHLQKIWNEEKFFAGLLDCVSEARAAGLDHETAITRAKDLLASGDETTRAAYEDFWNLLALYENLLQGNGGGLDDAALFRLAASGPAPREGLFLLGFDEVPLLATELLQRWASHVDVVVPLAIPRERIEAAFRETAGDADLPAELALRGLLTGYAGERRLLDVRDGEPGPRRRFLEAHTPSEEARAAAALGRAAFADFDELRFVAPGGYFDDRAVSRPFREELGLPENFCARNALAHPVSRLFFHVLEIKHKDYSLGHGLEVAKLLEFTTGKFGEVASLAHKAGVRKGLADWKRKAENLRGPEKAALQEFAAKLESIGRALPDEGTAEDFSRAVTRITEEIGIALLAKTAPGPAEERDAHAALSTVLRNVLKLVAMTRPQSRFLFPEWLAELRTTLEGSSVGETLSLFPKVQLYRYGEWLPPAGARTLTLALGLNSGAGPSPGFQFFLEEGARRRLSELLLPTNVQRGLGFLDAARRLTRQTGPTLLSWSAHDDGGGEAEPHWVTGALELERGAWPEMPREAPAEAYRAPDSVSVGNPGFDHFSASFFELYKQCPFRAFAERVLRLEDKVQESSLDVSRLEEGSFVHKVLELYYRDHGGREITDAAERERVLDLCVREAGARVRVEYYKGNENLFESQVARLRALLLNFLALDGEQYARFPFFSKVEVEKEVSGELEGGFRWQGKIDRVDYDEKNRRFLVTDYKIGASPPANAEVNELKRFQLQLYMDAVERERVGWEPIGGIYASVTSGERGTGLLRKEFASAKGVLMPGEVKYFKAGATSRALHDAEAFADLRARSRAEATRLAQLAAAGEFPVRPDDEETSCPRCPVRPACRVRDLRSPPLEPWPRPAPGGVVGGPGAPPPPPPPPAPG